MVYAPWMVYTPLLVYAPWMVYAPLESPGQKDGLNLCWMFLLLGLALPLVWSMHPDGLCPLDGL